MIVPGRAANPPEFCPAFQAGASYRYGANDVACGMLSLNSGYA